MIMKRIAISFALLAAVVCMAAARDVRRCSSSSTGNLTLLADSIDFRSDLTRLYGQLQGRPHTSGRIDRIYISVDGVEKDATDIDGVDFKRWFQWEDGGLIPVEIDLPPLKPGSVVRVYAVSPRGAATWVVKVGKSTGK
ncbi:MAG: hypothetical protein K2H99_03800 [Paramuribaculum sp.]|nr:hypothetical protein [Paramuribaculum sp.]